MDLLRIIIAIRLPPLGVLLQVALTKHFLRYERFSAFPYQAGGGEPEVTLESV